MEIYNIEKVYNGFHYPQFYKKILELNLIDFDYWYLMNSEQIDIRINGLKSRYPNRKLVPFARRDDNDDIACFEVDKGERVQIIHDFASVGYEQRGEYDSFKDWVKAAIEELMNMDNIDIDWLFDCKKDHKGLID